MEIIKTIRYFEERKKWNDKNKREKVYKEKNYVCERCYEKKSYKQLNIEHDFPTVLGGTSIKVMCLGCHKKKTIMDTQIIAFFKKMRLISTNSYETDFFISPDNILELYYKIRRNCEEKTSN